MSSEDKLRNWLIGIGLVLALAMLLSPVVFAEPYEYVLHYPTDDGATQCVARAYQLGETVTDSVVTTTFPDDTSITLDSRYLYNLEFVWIYPGPETLWGALAVPPTDTATTDSLFWTLHYTTSGGYDSVLTRWRRNGVTSMGSFMTTSFPFDTSVYLNPNFFHKFEYDWYDDTSIVYGSDIVPSQLAPAGGSNIPDPGGNLCTVYGYVGGVDASLYQNALVVFTLASRVNDTCNNTIITNFARTTKTDSDGRFALNLIWSACLKNAEYNMKVFYRNGSTITKTITVPSEGTYRVIW